MMMAQKMAYRNPFGLAYLVNDSSVVLGQTHLMFLNFGIFGIWIFVVQFWVQKILLFEILLFLMDEPELRSLICQV